MSLVKTVGLALLVAMAGSLPAIAGAAPAKAADQDVNQLIQELRGPERTTERTPAQYQAVYQRVLDALLPDIGSDDLAKESGSQQTWQDICFRAGRPGAEAERMAACKAMIARLTPDATVPAKVWMLRQLERLGRAESVDAVARMLYDPDDLVRHRALAALQNIPVPQASQPIIDALEDAYEPEWIGGLLSALGYRHDPAGVDAIAPFMVHRDPVVGCAAAAALGKIGGPKAVAALQRLARRRLNERTRRTIKDSLLLCADMYAKEGCADAAAALYAPMLSPYEMRRYRIAALRGLALSGAEGSVPAVVAALKDPDESLQAAASRLLVELPGKGAGVRAAALLKTLPPAGQVMVIRALADRGDTAVRGAVLEAAKSEDAGVRVAALAALARLGDSTAVPVLAKAAATAEGVEGQTAHASLVALRGKGVDDVIVAFMKASTTTDTRSELIGALSERGASSAAPALLEVAAKDTEQSVRVDALNALGALAGGAQLPALVELLVKAPTDPERAAAERAVGDTLTRVPDVERRAAPLLTAHAAATGPTKLLLLRLLGRTGSPRALEVIRAALKAGDADTKDSAVQAISVWPDVTVANDLLALARSGDSDAHREMALTGYIRVVGLPSQRTAPDTVKLYQAAIPLAQSQQQKEAIVQGLGGIAVPESLTALQPLLTDAQVGGDAGSALTRVAGAIATQGPDVRKAAVAALKALVAGDADLKVKAQAQTAMDNITRAEDWIAEWQMSPVYSQDGVKGEQLQDMVFAPEKSENGVKWTAFQADKSHPWDIDLRAVPGSGDDKTIYLRTRVQSPKEQEVQIQVGSDDGVKVWLNGALVHSNSAPRPNQPGQDKVKATLKAGWNDLLVKITNYQGNYAFSCRIRTPDGDHVDGLVEKP